MEMATIMTSDLCDPENSFISQSFGFLTWSIGGWDRTRELGREGALGKN